MMCNILLIMRSELPIMNKSFHYEVEYFAVHRLLMWIRPCVGSQSIVSTNNSVITIGVSPCFLCFDRM